MKRRLLLFRDPQEVLALKKQDEENEVFALAVNETGCARAALNVFKLGQVTNSAMRIAVSQVESSVKMLLLQSIICSILSIAVNRVVWGVAIVLFIEAFGNYRQLKRLKKSASVVERSFEVCQTDLDRLNEAARNAFLRR